MARGFRGADYVRDARRGPRRLPGAARDASCSSDDWDAFLAEATRVTSDEPGRARGAAAPRRPDQHPVHVGHDRLAQGRDALAPQHPQQRATSRPSAGATPSTTACASRCRSTTASGWCSAASAASPTARASSCRASRSTPRPCSRRSRPSAARRCYGVPTMFIAELERPALRALRPLQPAHGDDGRRAVPGRGHAAGALADAHGRGRRSSAA